GPDLALYQFARTPVKTVDSTLASMKQFIGETPTAAKADDDNTVRFVSDKDVNTTFEQNLATGDLRFQRNFSAYLGDFKPTLPTSDEAIKIAQTFLAANGLQAANERELTVAHVGGLRASSMIGDKPGPVIDKLVTVNFARQVNDLPVIGPGSKMVVNIGNKGEIIGVIRHWRELAGSKKVSGADTYSIDEAKRIALAQMSKEFGSTSDFEILQSKIAYYDNNGVYLQPVYAFETRVVNHELGDTFNYVSVVPAIINAPEALNLRQTEQIAKDLITRNESVKPSTITKGFD
ncbi:MAG TPA: hypothetical protein PKC70_12745, partial [Cellvibrionaceae bacterium]|nr:hypothetical protein [Cellvibrionaceae bacterium]